MAGHDVYRCGNVSSTSCRVPQELIDKIIGYLDRNTRAIYQCTLVSSQFHTPAFKLLHKKLILGPTTKCGSTYKPQTTTELRDAVWRFPEIAKCLQDITLTNHGPLYTWLNQQETQWLETDSILKHLFRQCPSLCRLALTGCDDWKAEVNRFSYRWFSQPAKNAIIYVLPQLTSLKLQYVASLPLELLFMLPPMLKELTLHCSTWDFSPPPYPPSGPRFENADSKQCQLEKLCLFVENIGAKMLISIFMDLNYGPGITKLPCSLHLDLMEGEDHLCSMSVLHYCHKMLQFLEYAPSDAVINGDFPEIIDYSSFDNLERLIVRLPVAIYGESDRFEWVGKAAAWLLGRLGGLSHSPSKLKMKTNHLKISIEFVEEGDEDGEEDNLELETSNIEKGFELWGALDRLVKMGVFRTLRVSSSTCFQMGG